MLQVLSAVIDGQTVIPKWVDGCKDADFQADDVTWKIEKTGLKIEAVKRKLFRREKLSAEFPWSGQVEKLDTSVSKGGAAVGAIAGGVLLGPLGLIGGGLLGAKKRHAYAFGHEGNALIVNVSGSEMQRIEALRVSAS